MIIDAHAHIFPYLGDAPGRGHLRFLQRGVSGNQQPVRRTSDNVIVPHRIWDEHDFSPAGYHEVDFRVGRFGRFDWTVDGVDYYKQFMPPSLVENRCDADYLVAEMDYAGIDRAVLQNDHFYGSLNEQFAEAVRRYPDRFLGTAHIDEAIIGDPTAIEELERVHGELGLRGIFYDSRSYWSGSTGDAVDEPRFRAFWRTVERLNLVVYWVPGAPLGSGTAGYLGQLNRWLNLLHECPTLTMVIPCGLPMSLIREFASGLPREVIELARTGHVCYELCYPILVGGAEEYPYASALDQIRLLYQQCGPAALAWGSDVPNVLRYCTYAQSLEHLSRHAPYIPPDDLAAILGGNLARFFRLSA